MNEEMDTRTRQQVQEATIKSICALQDAVGVLFPWRIDQYDDNRVSISNETIQEILKHIKKEK